MGKQNSWITAAQVEERLEKARQEGITDISMSTFYRLVRDGYLQKDLPEDRVREALYNPDELDDLIRYGTPSKRKAKEKRQKPLSLLPEESKIGQPSKGMTDWIQPGDLAYVYVMDAEVYGVEHSVSPTTTLTWWRKNPHACRILFNQDNRKEIWGALSVIPMEEKIIYSILKGDLKEQDITADHVLEYQSGKEYSCYIASAAIRPEHQPSFALLLHSMMNFWCQQSEVKINSLYAFALHEDQGAGLRLIRKLYFAPRYDLGENAWELRPNHYNPSPVIQKFQQCLQSKRSK